MDGETLKMIGRGVMLFSAPMFIALFSWEKRGIERLEEDLIRDYGKEIYSVRMRQLTEKRWNKVVSELANHISKRQ